MLEYYREHWYYMLLLFAVAVGVAVLWSIALRKRAASNRVRNNEIACLKEQKAALDAYRLWLKNPDEAISDKQLFTGFSLDVQSRLQHEPEQAAAFAMLPTQSRQIYALYFALEDVKYDVPSQFFREYGKPLTTEARNAMNAFMSGPVAELFDKIYSAYDPDDEKSSLIPAQIAEWDAEFISLLDIDTLYSRIADCLRK